MDTNQLIAELESRFDLERLRRLTRDLLGLDPDQLAGGDRVGSFARALVGRAMSLDALEALCDAVSAEKPETRALLEDVRRLGFRTHTNLDVGSQLGPYRVLEQLSETSLQSSYLVEPIGVEAQPSSDDETTQQRGLVELTGNLDLTRLAPDPGRKRRMSVLKADATLDRRGLQRFLTVSRICSSVAHPALPRRVIAGPLEDQIVLIQDQFVGETLANLLVEQGVQPFDNLRWVLLGVLDALSALHQSGSVHGFLTSGQVVLNQAAISGGATPALMLLGAGESFLLGSIPGWGRDRLDLLCRGLSPEQIQGHVPDVRSDLYSFGALAFELISGRPPYMARSAQGLFERLTQDAPALSRVAAAGSAPSAVSELIANLLERDPARRPTSAAEVSEALQRAGRRAALPDSYRISDEDLNQRLSALLENPGSEDLLAAVEGAVDQGAEPIRVADGLVWVASSVAGPLSRASGRFRKRLLFRAAMIYESAGGPERAEGCYAKIIEQDASDGPALAALERVRRRLGKHEALIEMLLERREAAQSIEERARALAEIGRIYKADLADPGQALIAFAQAFAEDPMRAEYADEVERLAGTQAAAWSEAIQSMVDALESELSPDARATLLVRLGQWYTSKLARPDLGLPCFQQVISIDPSNAGALSGMSQIYRQARQWPELGMVLTARADAARAPAEARDYRAEAAELLATEMNDSESARALFEQILEEDPHHPRACAGLDGLYASLGRHPERLVLLERRLMLAGQGEQAELNLALGELCEFSLKNPERAGVAYEAALAHDPGNLDALKGADRVYSQLERYTDLLQNLQAQLRVAVTPRQKITLWSRVAAMHAEEFLDHAQAADAWENILDLEPNHAEALAGLLRHYTALERWSDVAVVYERRIGAATRKQERVELGLELAQILAEKANVSDRAIYAYEQVLELDPDNTRALTALAELQARAGDSHQALEAVETLAKNATSPEDRARHLMSAARMLEERGDGDLAVSRYAQALQAQPTQPEVLDKLTAAYVARGDLESALTLHEHAFEHHATPHEKAAARARRAELLWAASDTKRAFGEARRALDLDRQNVAAQTVLARLSHASGNFTEAAQLLESVLARSSQLSPERLRELVSLNAEALAKTGQQSKAMAEAEHLLELSQRSSEALRFAGDLNLEHGSPRAALELYWELLHSPQLKLDPDERAELIYRVGVSAQQAGDLDTAEKQLTDALRLNPDEHRALRALAEVQAAREQWQAQLNTLYRLLECAPEADYVDILVSMGDLAAERLGDAEYAAKNYLSALGKRPGDRGVLLKLMRLYSQGKDWERLIEVILNLADLVEDDKQRAKYLMTAAGVCREELSDLERAAELYMEVISLDPTLDVAADRALEVMRARGDLEAVKELLKAQLKRASDKRDQARMLGLMDELSELYEQHFGRLEQALAVTQAALDLEPSSLMRSERLAQLYAQDPARYLDKALAAHAAVLAQEPYRASTYRSLFDLYSRQRDADSTWCVSQALYALNQASPEESSYFRQGRPSESPAVAGRLSHEDWLNVLMHPDADRLLTGVLSLLQATVLEVRGVPLAELGYTEDHRVTPQDQLVAEHTLAHDARCLGVGLPALYQNSNDPRTLSLLHTVPPSISLGQRALELRGTSRTFSFESSRALTYLRPGFYVRQVVSSHKELRAWLSGAIRLFAPRFPVSAELAEAAQGAGIAIERQLRTDKRAALGQIVAELLQQGAALDLRRWMRGIDLTADRAGFILCDDLPTALQQVRQAEERDDAVTRSERSKELVRFSVSPEYFQLRAQLGLRRA